MARTFAKASSDQLTMPLTNTGDTFTAVTLLGVLFPGSPDDFSSMLSAQTSANVNRIRFGYLSGTCRVEIPSGNTSSPFTMPTGSTNQVFLAFTKPAGSSAGRFHQLVYSTGVWSHSGGTGSVPDGAAAGAGGIWQIAQHGGEGIRYDGDISALGYVNREMSDGEVETMARGRWAERDLTWFVEFPSGSDRPDRALRESSRGNGRQTSITGTTRSPRRDPPGFAFSINNRRR